MVPTVELPPATLPTLHFTVELNAPVPVTVGVHCEVAPVWIETGLQATVTAVMVGAGAVIVTLAEPDLVVSWVLVAVIDTGFVVGTALGAL